MGEGGIKNGQKNSDVFYGRPLTPFSKLISARIEYLDPLYLQSRPTYKQSRVSSSYQSSLNMFKQVYTYRNLWLKMADVLLNYCLSFHSHWKKIFSPFFNQKVVMWFLTPIKFFDPFQSKHRNWESYIDVSSRVVICWCSVNLFVL